MSKIVGNIQLQKKNLVNLGLLKKHLPIEEGDLFQVEIEENGRVILTPMKTIPADQVWFWTKEWQEGMREAREDFQEGRFKTYGSMDELVEELEKESES
ncbi:hypothetical protein [Effusibacillus consociatus]|uniref:AbrB family transcriptional regulator n=1 Tax=Effusibacillus consociatus TaxID=1117041 RepID=A0ABV9Q6W4_9BACL